MNGNNRKSRTNVYSNTGNGVGVGNGSAYEKPQGSRLVLKFFLIVGSIVGSFLLIVTIAAFGFMQITGDDTMGGIFGSGGLIGSFTGSSNGESNGFLSIGPKVPVKTNVLLVGIDNAGSLTDVMIVASFDREDLSVNMMSMPRDTYMKMDDDVLALLKSNGSNGSMKLNSIYNKAADKKDGIKALRMQIESILGIDINYYVTVDLEAFGKLVDVIGGVRMDLRPQGYYYSAPDQNLLIDIKGGENRLLSGKEAEGLVRFREGYSGGDLDRIKVQQQFMKELAKQMLTKEAIFNDPIGLLSTLFEYVKTDFNVVLDLPKYTEYLPAINTDNIVTYTLPGSPGNLSNGTSVFFANEVEIKKLVDSIFYNSSTSSNENSDGEVAVSGEETKKPTDTKKPTETKKPASSKNLKIQVLNGGSVAGLATKVSDKLKEDGYNVIDVGNYTGTLETKTRIMVKTKSDGDQFVDYFNDAVVKADTGLPKAYDVIIIIGTGEE